MVRKVASRKRTGIERRYFSVCFLFFQVYLFIFREREREEEHSFREEAVGLGREFQAGSAVSAEPHAGLEPTN